ncbi:KilA-N domain-containing protein [Aeromonas salmonicida]|uniref:KilA-N domain-containing protein n=1 Tax=Aeromonas salmonicida TaxID=645 RepID=UPI00259E7912|nr:KilA-N domain-containing protein [Aeromonas salmonicida]MDM5100309.1 KilA-N domain-containing protein [Aeromonas salmonicida]
MLASSGKNSAKAAATAKAEDVNPNNHVKDYGMTIHQSDRQTKVNAIVIESHSIAVKADGMYCLNDLHKAAMALGKATESQRPSNFLKHQVEFIKAIEADATFLASVKSIKGGVKQGTWAIEIVAMKYAGWIDASFEVQVYAAAQALRHGDIEKAVELSGSKAAKAALDDMRLAKAVTLRAQALDQQIKNAQAICNLLPHLSDVSRQTITASLVNPVAGADIIPLPLLTEHYYTATEVGDRYGISANKVGRLANEHGLKTEQYGKVFLDKSPNSPKQVESFRYNDAGMKAIGEIITLLEVGGAA